MAVCILSGVFSRSLRYLQRRWHSSWATAATPCWFFLRPYPYLIGPDGLSCGPRDIRIGSHKHKNPWTCLVLFCGIMFAMDSWWSTTGCHQRCYSHPCKFSVWPGLNVGYWRVCRLQKMHMTPVILITNCLINRLLGRRRSSNSTKLISETGPTGLKVSSRRVTLGHKKYIGSQSNRFRMGSGGSRISRYRPTSGRVFTEQTNGR